MEHIVTGCVDCPMLDSGANHEYQCFCIHPQAPRQFSDGDESEAEMEDIVQIEVDENYGREPIYIPETPKWCPLKKEPITISIKTNNDKDDITCIACGKKTKIWRTIDTWTIAYGENYCSSCSKK